MSERTLPHNLESERAILGAALLHPDGLATALSVIRPEDFFRTAHRRIFDAMQGLRIVDLVTLKDALGKAGQLDDIGGPAYLASLVDGVPRSTNVEHYCLGASERILTADLEWVPVGDISTDDKVIGFDEHPILRNKSSRVPRRRWRLAEHSLAEWVSSLSQRSFYIRSMAS